MKKVLVALVATAAAMIGSLGIAESASAAGAGGCYVVDLGVKQCIGVSNVSYIEAQNLMESAVTRAGLRGTCVRSSWGVVLDDIGGTHPYRARIVYYCGAIA
jgi:hypothetical protein